MNEGLTVDDVFSNNPFRILLTLIREKFYKKYRKAVRRNTFYFFCVWFVGFISLMIFGCTCSQKMSASKRWIFKMKEGLKNKRITKKWIKRITDICSPQNTKGVGNLGSAIFTIVLFFISFWIQMIMYMNLFMTWMIYDCGTIF